jgi:TPR repeat protein
MQLMTMRLPFTLLVLSLVLINGAAAQSPPVPPAEIPTPSAPPLMPPPGAPEPVKPPATKPAEKVRPRLAPPPAPAAAKKPEPKPAAPVVSATPAPDNPNVDFVYGAYQRGEYKTTFGLALPRAEAGDIHAMTMLGELYANGLGVKRDYAKATDWYKRAVAGGDAEAMLALAMMRLGSYGGVAADQQEAAKLLASAAKLGEPKAAYNLALMYLGGQTLPQDIKRAAELMRQAADAGNAEAQYALATFYKEGTGVEKNMDIAVRLLQAASLADNVDAEVEYAIALYNGTGTPRNQPAAVALLRKAAKQGSPVAQNRLARVLLSGQGAPLDKVEALKWHLVAKTQGKGDPMLDEELSKVSPEERAKAEALAHRWLGDPVDATAPAAQPVPQGQAKPLSAPPIPYTQMPGAPKR